MDFSDESYVRLYTRKTLTSKLLGVEGRVVLRMMIDEFDAAGIFAIRGDAAQCIAAITELPLEWVRVGLERLIETETWIVTPRSITWPTYEEAQNCTRSDRIRKREYRRRRTDESTHGTDVPSRPALSRNVPESHPPFLPPSAPTLPVHPDPERAHGIQEPSEAMIPGLVRVTDPAGVSRTISVPKTDPPQAYLDEAVMRGISPQQARSTWVHYRGAGLPQGGVERLFDWLCQRAKERANRLTKVGPSPSSPPPKTAKSFEDAMKECP